MSRDYEPDQRSAGLALIRVLVNDKGAPNHWCCCSQHE